jgi:hypothetical protein
MFHDKLELYLSIVTFNLPFYLRYKYWPFEIMVRENEGQSEAVDGKSTNDTIYQFFVDTSQLIFPGRK